MTDRTWRMSAMKKFKRCPRSFWLSYGTGVPGAGFEKAPDPSKPAKLFWNSTGATLSDDFKAIGNELSNLRIVS